MNGYTPADFDRFQRRAGAAGILALVACAAGAAGSPDQFFRSYLFAYLFWIGIALGCFAIVMLHHLVGGSWGVVIRRLLESGAGTLPLMAVLILPLLAGLPRLYVWARPEAVAGDELLRHKAPYLNVPFFLGRLVFYFAVWIVLAHLLNKWSEEQDRTLSPQVKARLQLLSGPGLVLYGLTVTFASVDWVMSLEPHWFSTIYGILFMTGEALATLAFVILALLVLVRRKPMADVLRPGHFHDLGNLMLAFVMLWAYVCFSQFLIIWSGNLPEEIPWYLRRLDGGWAWVAVALIVFHFALPFVLLLSRQNKQRLEILAGIAGGVLLVRLVDLFWMVMPAFHPGGFRVHWMDLLMPVGIGGLWLAAFVWRLKRRPLLPAEGGY
ncbi:MAG TPA: hypothetical protein VNJ11_09560 [Bryobacteraceae bacterium]|nr:hypothetical protein [Bryobacteraceae bacterium]